MERLSPRLREFVDHAGAMATASAAPFSTEERFRHLLGQGIEALRGGSYGIAASYVIRGDGVEIELFGHNTLARGEPHGHAEMNAVRLAVEIRRLPSAEWHRALEELVAAGRAVVRSIDPDAEPGTELFSTLEPCPMCTVNILNAGVNAVTYAHPDELAGGLAPERLRRFPPLWPDTAKSQGLQVRACQAQNATEPSTYLPAALLRTLLDLFQISRAELDRKLVDRGFFQPFDLLGGAHGLCQMNSMSKA